jgi:hypothetical protein
MPLQFILLFYLAIMFYFSSYTRRRPIWTHASWVKSNILA